MYCQSFCCIEKENTSRLLIYSDISWYYYYVYSKYVQKLRILTKIKETTSTAKICGTGNHVFVWCAQKTVEIPAERTLSSYNLIVVATKMLDCAFFFRFRRHCCNQLVYHAHKSLDTLFLDNNLSFISFTTRTCVVDFKDVFKIFYDKDHKLLW